MQAQTFSVKFASKLIEKFITKRNAWDLKCMYGKNENIINSRITFEGTRKERIKILIIGINLL